MRNKEESDHAEKWKKLDESKLQQRMASYSEATAGALLDDAFGRWESRTDVYGLPLLDRADHIIIGGRTATELLMEKFDAQFKTMKTKSGELWNSSQRSEAYV